MSSQTVSHCITGQFYSWESMQAQWEPTSVYCFDLMFITLGNLEQYRCLYTDTWETMWYIHATEYYLAAKKNKVLTCEITHMGGSRFLTCLDVRCPTDSLVWLQMWPPACGVALSGDCRAIRGSGSSREWGGLKALLQPQLVHSFSSLSLSPSSPTPLLFSSLHLSQTYPNVSKLPRVPAASAKTHFLHYGSLILIG